jgi:hypothetical protein
MDVTDPRQGLQGFVAMTRCDDIGGLPAALMAMRDTGAEAVVVRNGGSPAEVDIARFAAELVAGAEKVQLTVAARRSR